MVIQLEFSLELTACLEEFEHALEKEETRLADAVTKHLGAHGLMQLKFIMDIPRLFRRTNRENPTKPSPYIHSSLLPIIEFCAKYKRTVTDQRMKMWLSAISATLGKQ